MAETFQLEIVTPDKLVVNEAAEAAQIPARNGYIGVLPGHAPLITELGVGGISYRTAGGERYLAVAWGFAEVLPDKVTILAETAERADDIDKERARQARERAEQRLRQGGDVDYDRAAAALERATTRLEVAAKAK
jgi:F-type H+-transporting ATPase subunit epsilon